MAFTYGFYNYDADDPQSDAKLYDAEQMSHLFDGIITDGVYAHIGTCFAVSAPSGEVENTVIIGTGRAWLNSTWSYNDSNYIMDNAPVAPTFTKRIDALVIDVNKEASNRHNEFQWVMGTESSSSDVDPVKPSLIKTSTHSQHAIAYILRSPNISIITGADISRVVGTDEMPFVTGVLETLSAEDLLANLEGDFWSMASRWESEFSELLTTSQSDFDTWFNASKSSFNSFMSDSSDEFDSLVSAKNTAFTTWFTGIQNDYTNLISTDTSRFNTWFSGIQNDYTTLITTDTNRFNTWFSGIQDDYDTLIATDTARFNTWFSGLQTTFNNFISTNQSTFDTWFNGLQSIFNSFISTNQSTFDTWLASIEGDYDDLIAEDRQAFNTWFNSAKKQFDDWFAEISDEFVGSATLTREGTASANTVSTQNLIINNSVRYEVSGSSYMEQSLTLSTSADTTYTFTNSKITTNSYIEVATDKKYNHKDISVSTGTCSVVYGPVTTAESMAVRIYIRND